MKVLFASFQQTAPHARPSSRALVSHQPQPAFRSGILACRRNVAEFIIDTRRVGRLDFERFPVSHAAAQELRPRRYGYTRIDSLRKETP
jgi:hypothetical protein